MLIYDDALQLMKDLASDTTSASATIMTRGMNVGYKRILADLGRPVTEKTQTATTRAPSSPLVASNREYQMPPDFLFMKSLTITISGQKYVLQEEESQELWEYTTTELRTGIPSRFFIRSRFGYSGATVLLDPIPAASGYTLEMVYEATDKDLGTAKYTTGTVTTTADSESVAGSGTSWTTKMIGRYFQNTDEGSDGLWYRIVNVTSTTALTLENVYEGTTQAGVNYQVAEIFALPEEMHELPCYYGLAHYFAFKQNAKQEAKYITLFEKGLAAGKLRWATKSRGSVIRSKGATPFGNDYPRFFPNSGASS